MTSPQLEGGYTRIANELLEAVMIYPFSKREYKIILAIFRKTYGFGKKMDRLSTSQIETLTGVDRAHVSRSIRQLVSQKVLLKEQHFNSQLLGINKDYEQWGAAKTAAKTLPKQQQNTENPCCQNSSTYVPKEQHSAAKTAAKTLPKQHTQKKKESIKETLKERERYPPWLNIDLWEKYKDHRVKLKSRMTEHAEDLAIKKLEKLISAGGNQNEIIEQSIMMGWKGLFEEKDNGTNRSSSKQGFERGDEIGRQWLEDRKNAGAH